MADAEQIKVKISTESDAVRSGMEDAQGSVASAVSSMRDSFSSLRETAMRALETFGAFEGVRGIMEMVKGATEAGEQLSRLHEETGASVSKLSELQFAAEATGTRFGSVTMAIRRTQMELGQLRAGSNDKALSQALGDFHLHAADLADFPTLLQKIHARLSSLPAAIARADITQIFGGRGGMELIPLIENVDELKKKAHELGAVLSSEDVAALTQARDAENELSATWDAAKEKLVANLTPAINIAIAALQALATKMSFAAGGAGVKSFGVDLANSMIDAAEAINTGLMPVIKELRGVLIDTKNVAMGLAHPIAEAASVLAGAGGDKAFANKTFNWVAGIGSDAGKSKDAISGLNAELEALRQRVTAPAASGGKDSLGNGASISAAGPAVASGADAMKAKMAEFREFSLNAQLAMAQSGQFGSASRIRLLQQEADKAKQVFGAQSQEYERVQTELLTAKHAEIQKEDSALKRSIGQQIAEQNKAAEQIAQVQKKAAEQTAQAQKKAASEAAQTWQGVTAKVSQGFGQMFDVVFARRGQNQHQMIQNMLRSQAMGMMQSSATGLLMGGKQGTMGGAVFGQYGLIGMMFGQSGAQSMMSQTTSLMSGGKGGLLGWLFGDSFTSMISGITGGTVNAATGATGAAATAAGAAPQASTSIASTTMSAAGTTGEGAVGGWLGTLMSSVMGPQSGGGAASGGAAGQAGMASSLLAAIKPVEMALKAGFAGQAALANMSLAQDAAYYAAEAIQWAITEAYQLVVLAATALHAVPVVGPFLAGGGVIPSAAGGMMTPTSGGGFISVLHPREMVLPAHLSQGVQNIIEGRSPRGGDGTVIHHHEHHYTIHAVDAKSFQDLTEEHYGAIASGMERAVRMGHPAVSRIQNSHPRNP